MQHAAFNRLVDVLLERLLPLVPQEYCPGFADMLAGGEYAMALEDLVCALAEGHASVPVAELRMIERLVSEQPADPQVAQALQQLQESGAPR